MVVRALRVFALLFTCAGWALAEPSAEDVARADALFAEGKRLLDAGRLDEACDQLAGSQRLDPGGGTLLALALCHEKQARLAIAWNEYDEALRLARESGNQNRERVAESRRQALEPRIARLTIVVANDVANLSGLEVHAGET